MSGGDLDALELAVAAAIRGACPSDAACAAAGVACLDVHPVHSVVRVQDQTTVVEADVNALAKLAVRVMRERGNAPCWGCGSRGVHQL